MRKHEKEQFAEAIRKIRDAHTMLDGNSINAEQWQEAKSRLSSAINDVETLRSRLDQTHMNYSNQETAFADIFISNNQWALDHVRKMLDEIKRKPNNSDGAWTDEQFVVFTFADKLKGWFEDMQEALVERASNGLLDDERPHRAQLKDIAMGFRDIGSLHRVEWNEVARSQMAE
jgi:hypothetical protein